MSRRVTPADRSEGRLRLVILFQECVTIEGQYQPVRDRPRKLKADLALTLFATRKKTIGEESGLMHQTMRIVVHAIHATGGNCIAGTEFHYFSCACNDCPNEAAIITSDYKLHLSADKLIGTL